MNVGVGDKGDWLCEIWSEAAEVSTCNAGVGRMSLILQGEANLYIIEALSMFNKPLSLGICRTSYG